MVRKGGKGAKCAKGGKCTEEEWDMVRMCLQVEQRYGTGQLSCGAVQRVVCGAVGSGCTTTWYLLRGMVCGMVVLVAW